jgi:hypothetical protein
MIHDLLVFAVLVVACYLAGTNWITFIEGSLPGNVLCKTLHRNIL